MSRRALYKHLDTNELLNRSDDVTVFLQMSHYQKTKFLQKLYREYSKEFYYYYALWKNKKQEQRS